MFVPGFGFYFFNFIGYWLMLCFPLMATITCSERGSCYATLRFMFFVTLFAVFWCKRSGGLTVPCVPPHRRFSTCVSQGPSKGKRRVLADCFELRVSPVNGWAVAFWECNSSLVYLFTLKVSVVFKGFRVPVLHNNNYKGGNKKTRKGPKDRHNHVLEFDLVPEGREFEQFLASTR